MQNQYYNLLMSGNDEAWTGTSWTMGYDRVFEYTHDISYSRHGRPIFFGNSFAATGSRSNGISTQRPPGQGSYVPIGRRFPCWAHYLLRPTTSVCTMQSDMPWKGLQTNH